MTFAGGLVLDESTRWAGAAILHRTWDYALHESGADAVAHRPPGGHQLTAATVEELGRWITQQLA